MDRTLALIALFPLVSFLIAVAFILRAEAGTRGRPKRLIAVATVLGVLTVAILLMSMR